MFVASHLLIMLSYIGLQDAQFKKIYIYILSHLLLKNNIFIGFQFLIILNYIGLQDTQLKQQI